MPSMVGGLLTRVPQQPNAGDFRDRHFQQVRDVRGRFAGGWGFAWVGLTGISNNIQDLNTQVHRRVRDAAESLKDEMVAYAKANAPWQNPTGDARAELQGAVVWEDDDHFTIFLGHGSNIHYGVWLEVRWGGKFAIIVPTIMEFAPRFGERIRTM